jgi:hypothetical protein
MARAWREAFGQPGYFGFGDVADERAERGNRENSLSVSSFRLRAREQWVPQFDRRRKHDGLAASSRGDLSALRLPCLP